MSELGMPNESAYLDFIPRFLKPEDVSMTIFNNITNQMFTFNYLSDTYCLAMIDDPQALKKHIRKFLIPIMQGTSFGASSEISSLVTFTKIDLNNGHLFNANNSKY
ncbi:hypothetical protein GCM10011607_12470 [Shewanella inventionis]|uniref:Uncharacterized protein n=1 Tax=Shewanella inventionis TaxID=1738770 RepID=A0ABQ1IYQ6_9GAMM|nr:hypothetical protein [Shewanella inventionis]GGB53424.1 hypothetical protein GCM10011607_12470 [Shewanella inventionis]